MKTASDCVNILLLSTKGSDNTGDQVIEACDMSLLSVIMKNLNQDFHITSRSVIIATRYMRTKDPRDLQEAEDLVRQSDIVIFGGAPMFNFLYQDFYERTAVLLELIEKHGKPVLFSAIGVEGYDDDSKKCQRLKQTLNFDCVKQITTRDDFETLQKYKAREDLILDKVADPAVFASKVFEPYKAHPAAGLEEAGGAEETGRRKKAGIFILRQGGFMANKVAFSRDDAVSLWLDLIQELEARDIDYELVTSGHFSDEAFLDYLIRKHHVPENKCVFNINSPEKLVHAISSYDAVISCRLHPSIVSFALDVPSLGIVWNQKVRWFYDSIGYEDRVFDTASLNPGQLAEKLEQILSEGVEKKPEFLMTVYHTLFFGIKNSLGIGAGILPYKYEEVLEHMPAYPGTSAQEQDEKLKRKFRRTYSAYNKQLKELSVLKKRIAKLEAENKRLKNDFFHRCRRRIRRVMKKSR